MFPNQGITSHINQYGQTQHQDRRTTTRTFRPAAALITGAGIVAVVVSFTALPWLAVSLGFLSRSLTLGDLSDLMNVPANQPAALSTGDTLRIAYAGWLGWVVLVIAGLLAICAISPVGAAAIRALGAVVACCGALLTLLFTTGFADDDAAVDQGAGVWVALIGFIVIGVGSMVGPSQSTQPTPPGFPDPQANPYAQPSEAVHQQTPAVQQTPSMQQPPDPWNYPPPDRYPSEYPPERVPLPTAGDFAGPPPAGQWASDPTGRHHLRYHDGYRWTEHVSTYGVNRIDPI